MKKKIESKSRTSSSKSAEKVHRNGLIEAHDESDKAAAFSKSSSESVSVGTTMGFPLTAVVITMVTLALRTYYVMDRSKWVTVHPDEVFQSMEVAHTEHYGYGFRPYEFLSPFDDSNNVTLYRQMELDAGLSAMRSPIFPYYYVIAVELTSFVGIDASPYLIFRLAHIVVTSLLPLAVYFYCTSTFHSTEIAIFSAALTTSSIHLNVLGTHCFLQSFLSPLVFLTLALIASSVNDEASQADEKDEILLRKNCVAMDKNNNSNIACDYEVPRKIDKTGSGLKSSNFVSLKRKSRRDYVSILPEYLYIKRGEYENMFIIVAKVMSSVASKSIVIGFLIGSTCYIRPDVVLIYFVNLCILMSSSQDRCRKFLSQFFMIFVGLSISFLFCVTTDTRFYGGFTMTPWNWFFVNFIQNISTSLFGKMDFWFYFTMFYSHDMVMCGLCVLSLVVYTAFVLVYIFRKFVKSRRDQFQNKKEDIFYFPTRLLLACICLLVIYSCHGHKEMRFLHDTVVFVLIFSSLVISKTLSLINIESVRKKIKTTVVISLVAISAFQWHRFYNYSSTTQWTYQHAPDTQNTNACLEFISRQSDVTGVFLEDNIFLTGGMTILHKNVPVFSRVMNGFFEFDTSSRTNITSRFADLYDMKREKLSVNTFTRVSNYVSQGNLVAILRSVLEKQEYNYFVLTKDQPFIKMGFQQVFQNDNRKVLKRVGDSASELLINHVLDRLTPGSDVKTLIHEGDVLFHMRQYPKAAERFHQAIRVSSFDGNDVDAYLPLYECLKEMGQQTDAMQVMRQCTEHHGEDKCSTPRRITRLYG